MTPIEAAAREYLRATKELEMATSRMAASRTQMYNLFDALGYDATIVVDDTAISVVDVPVGDTRMATRTIRTTKVTRG